MYQMHKKKGEIILIEYNHYLIIENAGHESVMFPVDNKKHADIIIKILKKYGHFISVSYRNYKEQGHFKEVVNNINN